MSKHFTDEKEINAYYARVNLTIVSTNGRAGSMLLQSLLDGHPSIIVFPEVALSYDYFQTFKACNYAINDWLTAYPAVYKGFDPFNKVFNDKLDSFFSQNRANFESVFNDICTINGGADKLSSKTFMLNLSIAMAAITNKDLSKIKTVVFHHHNNLRINKQLPTILKDFPMAKMIIGIRHPIENALSFQTLDTRTRFKSFRNLSRSLRGWSVNSWLNMEKFSKKLAKPSHFKLMDLNALHHDPDYILSKLAEWLEVEPDESLKTPSILGVKWLGNSADGKPIESFEKKRSILKYPITLNTEKGLTSDEYQYAEYFCRDIMKKVGYSDPVTEPKTNILGFCKIGFQNIEFYQSNTIGHDRGWRKFVRRFGYSEILFAFYVIFKSRFFPIKSLKEYRLDAELLND